ncbi:MAG TPA: hypothetical protein DET40_08115 [Lentisphaeria bacterium]|nr:MAG: hypothetical protein A2X45_10325 [Lentisphaerae bacterium GWF2_50_93]HCE43499.1 hypothetical protein [Lentisphaeria bacterium]
MEESVHILGIRHHGPGSARSVLGALEGLKPDCVLVEGPPDAAEFLPVIADPGMKPPVALLVYAPDEPSYAVYDPFAEFSPEWHALRYAFKAGVPARFMDLPQSFQFGIRKQEKEKLQQRPETDHAEEKEHPAENGMEASLHEDPLKYLAEAAGYSDSERWWEHIVETRIDVKDLFIAIQEAMQALRENEKVPEKPSEKLMMELRREAFMRQTLRTAMKEGFKNIAVVCGAWHAPALKNMPPAVRDNEILKGLPKMKTAATWIPWTHGRLLYAGGYGAGIHSPGWYQHLWDCGISGRLSKSSATLWISRIAKFLREKDIDVSPAHVIETVRLAESLSALREHPVPGLPELMDAAVSVICSGDPLQLELIRTKLIIDEKLGAVPASAPQVPLQKDIAARQKSLRMQPEAEKKNLDLDLRKENDLARSHLLHRLLILGIPWGIAQGVRGKSGTFHEIWELQWKPEFSILIIEASSWGNTAESAASAFMAGRAAKANLPELTKMLNSALLAELPDAVKNLLSRLNDESAATHDVGLLMDAIVPLVEVVRYGNVRQTDTDTVSHVVRGFAGRICAGLPAGCSSMNEDAAREMYGRIISVNTALNTLADKEFLEEWHGTLKALSDLFNINGLISGASCRILLDCGSLDSGEVSRRLSLALSQGADPSHGASWIEGFLHGSGLILLHDDRLWKIIDDWVTGLNGENFLRTLPLLRRTFSQFASGERRQIGNRAKSGKTAVSVSEAVSEDDFDTARAEAILPVLAEILGLTANKENQK